MFLIFKLEGLPHILIFLMCEFLFLPRTCVGIQFNIIPLYDWHKNLPFKSAEVDIINQCDI